MKQWELPSGSKVKLPDGTFATFTKMDGMYAHWDVNGELAIGNYDNLEKRDGYYEVTSS